MRADREVALRIVLIDPPSGVLFALQRGKAEIVSPTLSKGKDLAFELTARVQEGKDSPNFLGPFVQGPRGGKFIYVRSGTLAGQADTGWTRRAKVGLQGITRKLIDRATAGSGRVLEARIAGTGRDGGPSCGTVPLSSGWSVVARR